MDPQIDTGGQAYPGFDEDGKAVLGQTLRADIAKHVLVGLYTNTPSSDEVCLGDMLLWADTAVAQADILIERLKR